jgi:hypothetical protein
MIKCKCTQALWSSWSDNKIIMINYKRNGYVEN